LVGLWQTIKFNRCRGLGASRAQLCRPRGISIALNRYSTGIFLFRVLQKYIAMANAHS
jgi:hypothetical protein